MCKGLGRVLYLVVVPQDPAQALHIGPDHLALEVLVVGVDVKLGLVVSLLPAILPQPARAHREKNATQHSGYTSGVPLSPPSKGFSSNAIDSGNILR